MNRKQFLINEIANLVLCRLNEVNGSAYLDSDQLEALTDVKREVNNAFRNFENERYLKADEAAFRARQLMSDITGKKFRPDDVMKSNAGVQGENKEYLKSLHYRIQNSIDKLISGQPMSEGDTFKELDYLFNYVLELSTITLKRNPHQNFRWEDDY